ncbi:hypothetical protein BH11MYX2_BH11MYX2_24140 [soil metagenome]
MSPRRQPVHALAACASPSDLDERDDVAEDGKADGVVRPLGTFETNNGGASVFNRVVLESNKTFNVLVGGGGEMDGTYRFTASANRTHRYIRFSDPDTHELLARCEYTFAGDVLQLHPAAVTGDAVTCDDSTLTRVPESAECTRLEQEFDPCLGEHDEGCFDIYADDIQACCVDQNSPSQLCADINEHLGQ